MFTHNHIESDTLERYVLQSGTIDPRQRQSIEMHLADCEHCRHMEQEMALFYANLRTEWSQPMHETTRGAVERILSRVMAADPNIIPLNSHLPDQLIQQRRPNVLALAAQDIATHSPFRQVTTLRSADERVFLRVLRENETGTHVLQVHADDRDRYAHALITFNLPIPPVLTDAVGEAHMITHTEIMLRNAQVLLHKRIGACTIDHGLWPSLAESGYMTMKVNDDYTLNFTQSGQNTLFLSIDHVRHAPSVQFIALLTQASTQVLQYEEDGVFLPHSIPEETLTLHLY